MADQRALSGQVALVGVGATKQGSHAETAYHLANQALREAIDDAGISLGEIDGVLGARQFDGSGIDSMQFASLLGIEPKVTGSLDYATGGFLTQYAAFLVASGVCEMVACVFGRNIPEKVGSLSGAAVFDGIYRFVNSAALAGLSWTQYCSRHSAPEETLGYVALEFRKNAQLNPNAAWTDSLTMEDYLNDPYVVWPLRSLDIARITAGAVAIIVTSERRARSCRKAPVLFLGVGRREVPLLLESDGFLSCQAMEQVAAQAYGAAGVSPSDIDVLGISDASTVAVVQTLENYGFCGEGEAPSFIAGGGLGLKGSVPTNTDGGQLSGGYLVGWLHQVELVRQLRGEAGERQIPEARIAQYCTTGGLREHFLSTIYGTSA